MAQPLNTTTNKYSKKFYKRPVEFESTQVWKAKWEQPPHCDGIKPEQIVPIQFESNPVECCHEASKETLYGWLMWSQPKDAKDGPAQIHKHLTNLVSDSPSQESHAWLRGKDPNCVVYIHGNNANIMTPKLVEIYCAILEGCREKSNRLTLLLAFDYRGYGASTGSPSEAGIIADTVAAVDFALDRTKISAARLVIVGHSLGSALAAAVYSHFILHDRSTSSHQLIRLVLISAFRNFKKLIKYYTKIGIPYMFILPCFVLGLRNGMPDVWDTQKRLEEIAKHGNKRWNVCLAHSNHDFEIIARHSKKMYAAMKNACPDKPEVPSSTDLEPVHLREKCTWEGNRELTLLITKSGDHRYTPKQPAIIDEMLAFPK